MISGTIISPVMVYYDDGRQALQARAGDRVEANTINSSNKWIIYKLIRNGRSMLKDGLYFVDGNSVRNDTPPESPAPVPGTGIRAYIYRNHEKQDVGWWPNHPPIPDTRNIVGAEVKNNGRVLYTKRLQYFLYNNLRMLSPHDSKTEFHKDFKYWTSNKLAFFNSAGSDTRRVWPLSLNMDKKDMENNQLCFGGWKLDLLNDKPEIIHGELRFPFPCLDAFDDEIEKYNVIDYPEYWVRPSITYGPDVVRQEPFSQFHGYGRIPMILNGTKIAWIQASKVRLLGKDEPTPNQFTFDWAG